MRIVSSPWFRPVVAVVGVLGLLMAVWGQGDAIAALPWRSAPAPLGLAAVLFAVGPVLQALTWVWALRRGGADAPWVPTLRVWARSFLLRYEPSGAVGFAYRVAERERVGASTAQVLVASAYEQLTAVLAGALVAAGALAVATGRPPVLALSLLAAALVVAVLARPRAARHWAGARLAARGVGPDDLLPGRTMAAMVLVQALGWVATGAGVWLTARALGLALDPAPALGAFALSWLLGVLVPLAPGGLGLRDGSLIVALAAAIGTGAATGLAVALRLVSFAGELLATALLELSALVLARAGAAADRTLVAAPVAVRVPEALRHGTIVVVPTYEEAEALPRFVERFATTGLELLVVDDASPDGTGAIADALAAGRPWMHVLHRDGKEGLGVAYRAGFTWCLDGGYAVVGQMDCDLSHPPEKLGEMLGVLDGQRADLVIANRYAPGGGTQGWSRFRRVLSRAGCTGSKLVLGLPYDDLSGGFKLWRAATLADLDFDAMRATGYAFQVETTLLAHLLGKRIEEVPFVFTERVAGASKMSPAIAVEGIRVTVALRRHHGRPRVA